jgi:hypothetical protein
MFPAIPALWAARLRGSPNSLRFDSAILAMPLFPVTGFCQNWPTCQSWASNFLQTSPDWAGVLGKPATGVPPKDRVLAHFWHEARNEPKEMAWIRQSGLDLARLQYLRGENPNYALITQSKGNTIFLNGIETSNPLLLPALEKMFGPIPLKTSVQN